MTEPEAPPQRLVHIQMMVEVLAADSRAAAGKKPTGMAAAENTAVGDKVERRKGSPRGLRH